MPSSLSMGKLILRAIKGSPLTTAEMDANLTTIRDFENTIAAIISASLNTDGSLKASVIPETSLANRVISQRTLQDNFSFVALSTGAANAYEVAFTPAITPYKNGQVFFIASHQANTGAATLKIDALAATPIKKLGGSPLVGGEILNGGIFAAVYWNFGSGGAFYLLHGAPVQPPNVADITSGTNTVPNGSFETDSDADGKPDQWVFTAFGTGTGTLVTSVADQMQGLRAFKFTSAGGGGINGGGKLESANFLEVSPNRLFALNWQMKSSVSTAINKAEVDWFTEAQVFISTSSLYSGNASQPSAWTLFHGAVVVPSTARYAKIRLVGADATSPAANVYFDDVRLGEPIYRRRREYAPGANQFVAPAGCFCVRVTCIGGGGGGGGSNNVNGAGGGGGAGAESISWVNVVPGTSYALVAGAVGVGGVAGTVGGTGGNGGVGGTSTFNGATVVAAGGAGGVGAATTGAGGTGAVAGTGQIALKGEDGTAAFGTTGGTGGSSEFGGGGPGGTAAASPGIYGGGGSGAGASAATGRVGATGGEGRVIIEFSTLT